MQLLTSAFGCGRLLLLLALLQQPHTLQPGLDDIEGMQEQDSCATSDSSSQHMLPAHGTGSAGVLSYCCSRCSAVPAPSSLSLAILLRHVVFCSAQQHAMAQISSSQPYEASCGR